MANKQSTLYRLTLSEDATHKRIRLWRFSKWGAIAAAVVAFVVLFGIYFALVVFTPLKTTIPGYPDAHFKQGAIANAIKIDSLENEMLRWTLYADNLSRVLAGEESVEGQDSLLSNGSRFLENISRKEMARRDSILRSTVASEEKYGLSDGNMRNLPLEGMHFFTPLKGTVSKEYDMILHPAVDITAPGGSVVSAVLDGTVVIAGWTDENGYTLIIQHSGDIISCYQHNQQLLRKAGDKVKAGTPVALVGKTGRDKTGQGDYLHFELWYDGNPVDPAKYCSF